MTPLEELENASHADMVALDTAKEIVARILQDMAGANAMIEAIERLYPNWRKFRDLAEAVQFHNEACNKMLGALRARVDDLMAKLYPGYETPAGQLFQYLAVVAGGLGPDVWDKEVTVYAKTIEEAVRVINGDLQDGDIISIEQVD